MRPKTAKTSKKSKMTDELMDEATKRGVESRSTRLKTNEKEEIVKTLITFIDGITPTHNK